MPFNNFESRHFTTDEENQINETLSGLENALANKLANLSPQERIQFGSVKEHNKLIVNKVKEFSDTQPGLRSPDVDWEEFNHDFQSRAFLESLLNRLANLQTGLNNAKILHDFDNYKASLLDYDYSKYKNSTSQAGYEDKVSGLAQFFARSRSNETNESTDDLETPPAME